jgi:hypothetical protein
LQSIIDALTRQGYRVIGPTVREGAIVYDSGTWLNDLPVGWTDHQLGTEHLDQTFIRRDRLTGNPDPRNATVVMVRRLRARAVLPGEPRS